ncbi:hypothetical protein N201_03500 [Helicobacter pylori UM066]|nr:hypothetical protein N201_03500 [Helicobacter pylori UM066]
MDLSKALYNQHNTLIVLSYSPFLENCVILTLNFY